MKLLLSTLAVALALASAAPFSLNHASRPVVNMDIVAYFDSQQDQYSVLGQAIKAANFSGRPLKDAIKETDPLTIFAPNNAAFVNSLTELGFSGLKATEGVRLFNITAELIQETNLNLTELLTYHAVALNITAANLTATTNPVTTMDTLQGGTIEAKGTVLTDKATKEDDPTVRKPDTFLMGGTVHQIDHVLFYKNVTKPTRAIVDRILKKFPAPAASSDNNEVCFPASAVVHAADGRDVTLADLEAGHAVRVSEAAGHVSRVFLFSHKQAGGMHEFVRLTAATGHSITLSPSHYVHANGRLAAARAVRRGDVLRTVAGPAKVTSVERVRDFGLVAPHTLHGDIVVNGVVASTYTTTVHPRVARWLLAPLRAAVRLGLAKEPLGKLLYDGAPRAQALVPGGPDRF